jgi:hypothetical protein
MSSLPRGYESFDLLSGPQQQIYSALQQALLGQLGPEGDERFAAPFMRQFNEQIIPGLAERFSGLGAGSQSSSSFQQALGTSGADLSERLAAMSGQRQQSAMGGLQNLLGVQTQGLTKKASPWWLQLLLPLLQGAGSGMGMAATGGASGLSSLFGLGKG